MNDDGMTTIAHAPSWYAMSAHATRKYPAASGDIAVDICVIGGGLSGLSTALHLAEKGSSVLLLEAKRIGWGASGRNGGQIHSGFRRDPSWFAARYGIDEARKVWQTGEAAKQLVQSLIKKHSIKCDYRQGLLHACHRLRDVEGEHHFADEIKRHYGYGKIEPLNQQEMTEATGTDIYYGGWRDHGGGHLHPLNFALGLADAAKCAGVRLCEGSPALQIISHNNRQIVKTPEASISAETVVIAGNGYVEGLKGKLDACVLPMSNYILATEPIGAGKQGGPLPFGDCAADSRFVVHYWRPTPDGRLLFGGGETFSRKHPQNIAKFVHRHFSRIYPHLSNVEITHAWGGVLAVTRNRLPFVRQIEPNVFVLSGFSGQGVALAPFAGKVVAEAIAGDRQILDQFACFPCPPFPGGPMLRAPILALALTWFALRDRL